MEKIWRENNKSRKKKSCFHLPVCTLYSNVNIFPLKEVRELLRNGIITVTTIKTHIRDNYRRNRTCRDHGH